MKTPQRSRSEPAPSGQVRYGQPSGRWVLAATVLGSGLAFLDMTVVNVALPSIGASFHADAAALQWTVNGYTLTLAAMILVGGGLGDRYGRRRVFVTGAIWFAAGSLLCGLAPTVWMLILARLLQGVGGALLTPGSLAIVQATFPASDRPRAIGAWSGLSGVAGAVGPLLGGWLVQAASWRLVFLINVPLGALVTVLAVRHVPESRDPRRPGRLDLPGAATAALALAGLAYGFTAWPASGPGSAIVLISLALGVAATAAFLFIEHRAASPMLPLSLFASRAFTAANLVTLTVYAALSGVFFLVVLNLQVVAGYRPLAAGAALLPVTVLLLALSPRAGALAARIGPRLPMTVGPLAAAGAMLLLARVGANPSYLRDVLPGALLLGLGLAATVAPLTATALGSVEERHAGLASGVNNAVARTAGLLAVAILPTAAGLHGTTLTAATALAATYRTAMLICAGLLAAGAAIAAAAIPNRLPGQQHPGGDPS